MDAVTLPLKNVDWEGYRHRGDVASTPAWILCQDAQPTSCSNLILALFCEVTRQVSPQHLSCNDSSLNFRLISELCFVERCTGGFLWVLSLASDAVPYQPMHHDESLPSSPVCLPLHGLSSAR